MRGFWSVSKPARGSPRAVTIVRFDGSTTTGRPISIGLGTSRFRCTISRRRRGDRGGPQSERPRQTRLGPGDWSLNEGQARICLEKPRKGDRVTVTEKLDGSNMNTSTNRFLATKHTFYGMTGAPARPEGGPRLEHNSWRSIDSVPPNKIILLFAVTDRDHESGAVRNWKMETGSFIESSNRWWPHRLSDWDQQPTHWHFLPEPPK
jgi:hypothetical protein